MALDKQILDTLSGVTTATLTTILLKKGLRNVWLRGTRPLRASSVVGFGGGIEKDSIRARTRPDERPPTRSHVRARD